MYPRYQMRRVLSILVVGLFALAPLAAVLSGAGETQLPACCRRHGIHHCAMANMSGESSSSAAAFAAPAHCPLYHASGPAATQAFAPIHAAQANLTAHPRALPAQFSAATLLRSVAPSGRAPPARA